MHEHDRSRGYHADRSPSPVQGSTAPSQFCGRVNRGVQLQVLRPLKLLCEHPDARRFSTVTPRPPAPDSWWETFSDNAYHYGDLGRDPRYGSVTFWPILQPLAVICLTGLALTIFSIVLLQLFCLRAVGTRTAREPYGAGWHDWIAMIAALAGTTTQIRASPQMARSS